MNACGALDPAPRSPGRSVPQKTLTSPTTL